MTSPDEMEVERAVRASAEFGEDDTRKLFALLMRFARAAPKNYRPDTDEEDEAFQRVSSLIGDGSRVTIDALASTIRQNSMRLWAALASQATPPVIQQRAIQTARALTSDAPHHAAVRAAAVRRVLQTEQEGGDQAAGMLGASQVLDEAVVANLDALVRVVAPEQDRAARPVEITADGRFRRSGAKDAPTEPQPTFRDGVLALDAELVAHVKAIGASGAKIAEGIERKAKARVAAFERDAKPFPLWRMWLLVEDAEVAPKIALSIATALWRDRVRGEFLARREQEELRQRKPPAVPMAVHEPVAHLFSRVRREEERNGQRALVLPGEVLVRVASEAAVIGADTINSLMVNRGVKLFGSVASHRLLRWQIFTAHRQAIERNPDPRVLRVDGGYSTLAHEVLGMTGKKAAEQVRDIIEAMHATELPLPPKGNYSRLLIREAHTPRGRGKQWIKLVLGTALLPDYVHELQDAMGRTLEARRATRLVPILDIPPLIGKDSGGRDNEMGAQATFSMLIVAHIRDHGADLLEHGGVALSDDRLLEIARAAGLGTSAPSLIHKLIEHWTRDHFDGPALLKRTDKGRFTLGDAHEKARLFIEDGARREQTGRAAGEKGNRKRLSKLKRHGRA